MLQLKTILISNVPEILKMSEDAKQQALNKIGLAAEGYAKRLAPVDTGRLRASITYATVTQQGQPGSEAKEGDAQMHAVPDKDAVYLGTNVEYAIYQEFGTKKQPKGKHYIGRAISDHSKEYKTLVENTYKSFNA